MRFMVIAAERAPTIATMIQRICGRASGSGLRRGRRAEADERERQGENGVLEFDHFEHDSQAAFLRSGRSGSFSWRGGLFLGGHLPPIRILYVIHLRPLALRLNRGYRVLDSPPRRISTAPRAARQQLIHPAAQVPIYPLTFYVGASGECNQLLCGLTACRLSSGIAFSGANRVGRGRGERNCSTR